MWKPNEIYDGESGISVSDKLDSEFIRIQGVQAQFQTTLNTLMYVDASNYDDATINDAIMSPMYVEKSLDPIRADITTLEIAGSHLGENTYSGVLSVYSDIPLYFSGTFQPLVGLSDGHYVSKAHIVSLISDSDQKYVLVDGSSLMSAGYVPTDNLHIATKESSEKAAVDAVEFSKRVDFPASTAGDDTFAFASSRSLLLVYNKGVLMDQSTYLYSGTELVFNTPLLDGDKITIVSIQNA